MKGNFGGNIPAANFVINSDRIKQKFYVSKNVCHGVNYDDRVHQLLEKETKKGNNALDLTYFLMQKRKKDKVIIFIFFLKILHHYKLMDIYFQKLDYFSFSHLIFLNFFFSFFFFFLY